MSSADTMMKDALDTTQVLAARLPMMAMGMVSPTAAGQNEMVTMVAEKVSANVMGILAVQTYWAGMPLRLWAEADVGELMVGAVEAYAGPARATLRSNAKRLSNKSLD